MTNKEYIEKNNISFSEAMKMYDNEKYHCIPDWLKPEHQEHKFKVGDFVIYHYSKDYIGIVIGVKDKVYFKKLYRNGSFVNWDSSIGCDHKYHRVDQTIYYMGDQTIYYMDDENLYEKIF